MNEWIINEWINSYETNPAIIKPTSTSTVSNLYILHVLKSDRIYIGTIEGMEDDIIIGSTEEELLQNVYAYLMTYTSGINNTLIIEDIKDD